jgi:Cu(I)/Ag(I) efflux system membrane protein CusA/SilA
MIETIILLKPQKRWSEGKTKSDIITEINNKLQIPELQMDLRNRSSTELMLATGIRTDVGIKFMEQV